MQSLQVHTMCGNVNIRKACARHNGEQMVGDSEVYACNESNHLFMLDETCHVYVLENKRHIVRACEASRRHSRQRRRARRDNREKEKEREREREREREGERGRDE